MPYAIAAVAGSSTCEAPLRLIEQGKSGHMHELSSEKKSCPATTRIFGYDVWSSRDSRALSSKVESRLERYMEEGQDNSNTIAG